MYESEYKELKHEKITGYIFLVVGIFVLIFFGSFFFTGMIRKIGKNETVEADRVTIDVSYGEDSNTYRPTYYYTVKRKKYTYTPIVYTSIGVQDMKDTTLYYDSSDPSKVVPEYQTKFYWSYLIVLIFPAVFGGIGIVTLAGTLKKERKLKHLEEHGTLIRNLPCRVVPTNTYVNEEPVINIELDYVGPDGELIVFKQKKIGYYDDAKTADLLIDPNDLSMYYIDFEIEE